MSSVKFYSLKTKKEVWVDSSKVTIKTMKNGRKAATAIDPESGGKMFKFLSEKDLKELEKGA